MEYDEASNQWISQSVKAVACIKFTSECWQWNSCRKSTYCCYEQFTWVDWVGKSERVLKLEVHETSVHVQINCDMIRLCTPLPWLTNYCWMICTSLNHRENINAEPSRRLLRQLAAKPELVLFSDRGGNPGCWSFQLMLILNERTLRHQGRTYEIVAIIIYAWQWKTEHLLNFVFCALARV